MRATSVMRFVIFGAVGFGIGWGVAGLFAIIAPMWSPYFSYFLAGGCGAGAGPQGPEEGRSSCVHWFGGIRIGDLPHVYLGVHRLTPRLDEHRNGHGFVRGCDVGIDFWGLEEGRRSWAGGLGGLRYRGGDYRSLGDAICPLTFRRGLCRAAAGSLVAAATLVGSGRNRSHRWSIAGSGPRIPRISEAGTRAKTKSQINLKAAWGLLGWMCPSTIPAPWPADDQRVGNETIRRMHSQ